ncbi:MAG: hypothetical protein AAGA93_06030 [Actinomycetota bacterium]
MSDDLRDPAVAERRFLDSLTDATGLDRGSLGPAGTTVVGRQDRADTGALACYRAGGHLLVWGDPAVVDRVTDLGGPTTPSIDELTTRLDTAGFELFATVRNNLLAGPPTEPGDLAVLAPDLRQRWLRDDTPGVVDAVRAFTERCDPDEVEAAALDELDEFNEAAINVVVPADDTDTDTGTDTDDADGTDGAGRPDIIAYASASAFDFDPLIADIGVLVRGDHRRRGLATFVVASTTARLLDDGRVPLYRHTAANAGSAATAAAVGFRPVATLDYFVTRSDDG